jgi:uncharacterized membrane protein
MEFNIIHFPGNNIQNVKKNYDLFQHLKKLQNHKNFCDKITVITTNSQSKETHIEKYLKKYCKNFLILGKGLPHWHGFLKLELIYNNLKNIKTKYILYVDAGDCFILNDRYILEKFKEFNCEMVLNSAFDFFPYHPIIHEYKSFQESLTERQNKYLNAGAFLSTKDFLNHLLNEIMKQQNQFKSFDKYTANSFVPFKSNIKLNPSKSITKSDQFYLNFFLPKHPEIKLDYYRKIFCLATYAYYPYMFL